MLPGDSPCLDRKCFTSAACAEWGYCQEKNRADFRMMPKPKEARTKAAWEALWMQAWEQRNALVGAVQDFRRDAAADGWDLGRLHGNGGEPMHRAFTLRRDGLLIIGICRSGPPDYRRLPEAGITLFRDGQSSNGKFIYPCGLRYDWEAISQFRAGKPQG